MNEQIEQLEGYTELEKKLFDYIVFLMGLQNVHEFAFHHLYEDMATNFNWQNKNWELMEKNTKYPEMMEDLNNIFNWNFKLTPFEKDEENK